MRSPSSLIFIVLLGVWAAYFVQYWIRRRDHLATARSVDQFTAAMRVLERRDATPRTDLSAPAPPSYAVHPQRSARPQILVKRAVPAEIPRRSEVSVPTSPARSTVPATARAAAPATSETSDPAGRGRPAAPPRTATIRPSRRVRGIFLLAALVELVAIVPLVALSMVTPWVLVPSLLAPAWAVAWLRSGVRAEQAAARARRRRAVERTHQRDTAPAPARSPSRGAETSSTTPGATSVPEAPGAAARAATADPDAVTGTAEVQAAVSNAAAPTEDLQDTAGAFDGAAVVDAPVVPAALVDEDDIPLTWDPVPVPRPTYTMKARAERPDPVPAETTPAVAGVEQADDPAYDDRDTAYDHRRVAGA